MKHYLILLHLVLVLINSKPYSQQASLIGNSIVWKSGGSNGENEGIGNANVSYFIASGNSIPMKRVPEHKLKGEYIQTIRNIEQTLTQAKAFYDTNLLEKLEVLSNELIKVKVTYIPTVGSGRPKWNVEPYKAEVAFYLSLISDYKESKIKAIKNTKELNEPLVEQGNQKQFNRKSVSVSSPYSQTTPSTTYKRPATQKTTQSKASPKVYVCLGGSAYAYHSSSNCSGLNRCTHTIEAVSLKEAEGSYNRRPCKKCY